MSLTNKTFVAFVSVCFMLITFSVKAQTAKNKGDSIEVTETDFASMPAFDGNHATVFGIALGMGRTEAKEKLKNYQYLKLKEDPFNHKRFYVQDVSGDSAVTVAYLKWPNYDTGLYQIVIYPAMTKYLRGLSAAVVTSACIDPSSEVYKSFLGAPSASPVTMNLPDIKEKTIMHYYPKHNIAIEENQTAGKTTYNMVLTSKY